MELKELAGLTGRVLLSPWMAIYWKLRWSGWPGTGGRSPAKAANGSSVMGNEPEDLREGAFSVWGGVSSPTLSRSRSAEGTGVGWSLTEEPSVGCLVGVIRPSRGVLAAVGGVARAMLAMSSSLMSGKSLEPGMRCSSAMAFVHALCRRGPRSARRLRPMLRERPNLRLGVSRASCSRRSFSFTMKENMSCRMRSFSSG